MGDAVVVDARGKETQNPLARAALDAVGSLARSFVGNRQNSSELVLDCACAWPFPTLLLPISHIVATATVLQLPR